MTPRTARALALALLLGTTSSAHSQEMPPAPVRVAKVVEREVTPSRSFVGTLTPVRETSVGSNVEGQVVEFLAHEGQRVEAGRPLARLRTAALEIEIESAKADLELGEQELAELENGSRKEEIEQAEARLASREAERDHAVWQKENAETLLRSKTISEDEYREAGLKARAAELAVRVATKILDLLRAGPRAERVAQARANVRKQQAIVRRLEDDLAQHTIRAPFDGYVVKEHTEVGQWLSQGDAVARLAELDRLDVRIGLLEDYVAGLRIGAGARVEIPALAGRTFDGKVAVIVPQADPRARTFPVDVRLENQTVDGGAGSDLLLKAGLFARVALSVGRKEPMLLVPKDALVLGGGRKTVYVVAPDGEGSPTGKATPVPVETGASVGELIQVSGGLAAGDTVVVQGNERLRPGQSVMVLPDGEPPR